MQNSILSSPDTRAVPVAHASDLAGFQTLVSQSFVPLDITSANERAFAARVRGTAADNVAFTEVAANPHLVERTANTIANGGSGFYKVSLLIAGSSVLVQDGKELVMRPGELTIYDTSRPYSLLFDQNFRNLVMMFPKASLQLPLPFTDQLVATSFSREHPTLAPILTSFLSQFPTQLTSLTAHTRARLARTSIELVSTLCAGLLDLSHEERDPQQMTLQKLYRYIEQHLNDQNLSPTMIAEAHFISTRHLHSLFTQHEMTVSTWIREQRLERCANDLCNPALADRTVLAIATQWGFTDAAHFSRVFKAKYGVSPRAARQFNVGVAR